MSSSDNPIGYFFAKTFGSGPQSQSYEALAARRKIAEAMMARQTRAPKNVGEGLSAIGEAIGDRSYYNNVLADDAAAKGYETGKVNAPPPAPSSYSPYSPSVGAVTPPQKTSEDDTAPPPAPVADAGNYGYKPAPAYLRADLASSGLDPERQAYLGHLAGKEAQSASEVSPTGAAGPFQFTRGTGAQYGIPGGARFDPKASIAAASRLTDDNAATLGRALNRPPTGPELALAHQQGAGTAAKMLLGTGNASASNLAVNNASGGPQEAARKIMSYYAMPGGGGPRDQIAAAMTPPAGPMTPQDTQQEATMNDVVGMQKAPTAGYSYPATASRTGDVQSDVAPQGIRPTGGLGGDSPVASSVGDTVQARGDAIKGPMPITPEPNPPPQVGQIQTADATAPRPPGVTADASTTAPVVPPLGPKPAPPQLMPTENARTQHYEAIAADPRLSPAARENAKSLAATERAQINAFNAQKIQEYNEYLKPWISAEQKRQDPQSIYATEKARRELEGEGATPLTPEQRQQYGIAPGQAAYITRRGEIKFGPAGTTVSIDQAGEKQESKTGGELAAKRQGEMIEAANKAGENLTTVARAEELLKRIDTNAFAPGNTTLAAMGRAIGVSDDFMRGLGLKPEQIGSRQAFVAIVNELTMGKIGPGGMPANNFSEGDRKFLTQTQISLGDDPESNRIKLAAARTMAELHIERADKWGDWKEANPGKSYADFERIWNKELKSRNAFGELNRQARELLDRQKDGGQPATPQPQTPAALPYTETDKADAIKWIGDNPGSPKIQAIKQRYGLP